MKALILLFGVVCITIGCSSNESANNSKVTDKAIGAIPRQAASGLWLGTWERLISKSEGSLEVTDIRADSIVFTLSAFSGGHNGEIEGVACVKGNSATYFYKGEADVCIIEFRLAGDSVVTVVQKKGSCFTGMGVTYSGEYRNSKKPTNNGSVESLVSLGVFQTEEEEEVFKGLVGDNYDLFINSTQLISENDDLDSLNATVRSAGVRGLFTSMENIIMIDALNNIWAAVIDDEKVYYFTNSDKFKKELPKTIDSWRQRFSDYEVIFK